MPAANLPPIEGLEAYWARMVHQRGDAPATPYRQKPAGAWAKARGTLLLGVLGFHHHDLLHTVGGWPLALCGRHLGWR